MMYAYPLVYSPKYIALIIYMYLHVYGRQEVHSVSVVYDIETNLILPNNLQNGNLEEVITHISHYSDVIMGAMTSQITRLINVYSTVYSDADQRKHQSSASLAFVREIYRWPVISPHKGLVTWKIFPFDDVIMVGFCYLTQCYLRAASTRSPLMHYVGTIRTDD